ncbi:MAG: hypothetical protein PSN35_02940 [Candidatus Thioglobus sp.]|uniref:hypothetical protein n=1 Tax=Candidatus Thioglobus sp. TaxID=2026721 RepID=UPI002632708B|nr:hypothetical protein [Candidatus Thioglobus sp.]MDC9726778.1 hypothetical protein [Candidatus Thioglobus sp.]
MHTVKELEKQQVGLRMPAYLLNEIDELTKKYKVNRSEILIEAAKSYIDSVAERDVHQRLHSALKEVKLMSAGETPSISARDTIKELKDALENN